MSKPRLSGLQKQVLSLYRSALRLSRDKKEQGGQSIAEYARMEMDKFRSISRKDIQLIEHLLRKGRKQLELFKSPEVTGIRLQPSAPPPSPSSSGRPQTAGRPDAGSSSSSRRPS